MIKRFGQFLHLLLLVLFGGPGYEGAQQFLKENPHEAKVRPRVVIGGCLLLLGIVLIGGTIAWNFEQFRTAFWPTASGVIEKSQPRRARSTRIQTDVICSYTVDGVTYTTNKLKIEPKRYSDIRYAIEDADRYPAGSAVTVSYNPKKPHLGILEPGYDLMSNPISIGGVCIAVLGVGFLLLQVARSVSLKPSDDPFKSPDHLP